MRAIKIDPYSKTITEIELKVNPNRSLSELRSIIGCEQFQLIPLDRGINLLSGVDDETKPSFGFYLFDEPVIHGPAVVLGGTPHRVSRLHEGIGSFEAMVVWRDSGERAFAQSRKHRPDRAGN